MATDTTTAPAPPPTIPADKLPATLRPIAAEINALLGEMPRLLEDRQDGHYALLSDGRFVSSWDTFADAMQAAHERFGPEGRFVVQRIDRQQFDWLRALLDTPDETARNGAAVAAIPPGPTIPVEHMPENVRERATEINVYMREMPRLLNEGHEGHYALISADQLLSVWDTYGDALQAGYDRFGLDGRFIAQKISARYYERFLTLVDKSHGAPA